MIRTRKAVIDDMDSIYAMGYDAWGDNAAMEQYLEGCRSSKKYKRGTWYVYEDVHSRELLSALIVYNINPSAEITVRGLGSISTPNNFRKKGYASGLIKAVLKELSEKEQCNHFFLYSDIGSEFYKLLNFNVLPSSHQKYKDSICMYYSELYSPSSISFSIPDYF